MNLPASMVKAGESDDGKCVSPDDHPSKSRVDGRRCSQRHELHIETCRISLWELVRFACEDGGSFVIHGTCNQLATQHHNNHGQRGGPRVSFWVPRVCTGRRQEPLKCDTNALERL